MAEFLDSLSRGYVAFVANVGLLAILAWVVSLFGRHLIIARGGPITRVAVLVGVLFGLAAAMLMNLPVHLAPGIIGDARGGPLLLSGILGGPVAALIASAIAGAMRYTLGGSGAVTGVVYVMIFAASGCAWHYFSRWRGENGVDLIGLAALASLATAVSIPTILLLPASSQLTVLTVLWPKLWLANLIGALILGLLIQREIARQTAQQELEDARANAEHAAEAKSKFLAAMSHEIRTPLNGILGILQLVQRRDLPDTVRSDLKTARDSGFFLLTLINQVLDFARIEAGKTTLSNQEFAVASLVDGLRSMFLHQATAKGLTLEAHMTGAVERPLSGDYEHIRQILFNLIGNALKFTKQGRVDITARLEDGQAGPVLHVAVTDTGPGIPEADIGRVFEEFQQSAAGVETGGGTGLGLSIARDLTNALGGELGVSSVLGKGTTFQLSVPLDYAIGRSVPAETGADSLASGAPMRILVAEDNAVNQMIVRAMLEDQDHTVAMAGNGQEALDLLQRNPEGFDVVLMDVEMPVMGGMEATRRIRELPGALGDIPIVALTANAFTEQRQAYVDAGMNDVLIKPLRIDDLQAKLAEISEIAARETTGVYDALAGLGDDDAPAEETVEPVAAPAALDGKLFGQLIETLSGETLGGLLTNLETTADRLVERLRAPELTERQQREHAHEIRGMLSNFGLNAGAEAAAVLERRGCAGAERRALVDTLEAHVTAGLAAARDRLDGAGDAAPAHDGPRTVRGAM